MLRTMHMKTIYLVVYLLCNLCQQLVLCERRCRCIASNLSCWPNASQWQKFDESLNGHLLFPKPSAAVCNGQTYDAYACSIAKIRWSDAIWRSDQVGAMQNHNWEASSCSVTTNSTTCNQGAVSVVGVNATLPEHVQTTVRFAAANNLRLVVKSTGHDYLGRSGATGSLLLWLHNMKDKTLLTQYSLCNGTIISNVARISAGVQWGEVYRWLDNFNLTAIGGAASSVAAVGGYLQGGGHSPLSRWQGLAVDQVLEYDVVLADGERHTVSACQNADLFWALNGGGGGTYAIVLSAVIRTFPSPYIIGASYEVTAPDESRYTKLIQSIIQVMPTIVEADGSGYFQMVNLRVSGVFQLPNGDFNKFNNTMHEFAANNSDLDFSKTNFFAFPSFYSYFAVVLQPSNPTGFNVLLSSRLIPENIIRDNPNKVAEVFVQAKGEGAIGSTLLGHLVAGGKVSDTSNLNNSVNPGWRNSQLHMVYAQPWLDTTSQADQNYLARQVSLRAELLNALSTDSHGYCYGNEADPNDPNWQETFYGSKVIYNQLKSIKDKYDPDGLFVCKNCVGSDDWTSDLNCPNTASTSKVNFVLFLFVIELIAILT